MLADEERFEFRSLIRLSDQVFHAFGDEIKPAYPDDPSFWMDYDSVILDTEALTDLNATLVDSLRTSFRKRAVDFCSSARRRKAANCLVD